MTSLVSQKNSYLVRLKNFLTDFEITLFLIDSVVSWWFSTVYLISLFFTVILTFFSLCFLLFYLLFFTLFSPRFLLSFHHVSYFLFTCSYFLFTDRMKVLVFVALMCLAMVSAGPDYYRTQYYNQYPGLYSSTATKIISFNQDFFYCLNKCSFYSIHTT